MNSTTLRAFACALLLIAALACAAFAADPAPTPDQALQWLIEGNILFTEGATDIPHTDMARIKETAGGQHPFATILTCSDSRVPAELIFHRGIGDLFVVRVAGNVADIDEIGTIEYGTHHLHTPVLIVMGHSNCGAVKAVLNGDSVGGSIPALVDNVGPAIEQTRHDHPHESNAEIMQFAVSNNVWQSIHDILTNSHTVAELVKSGKLRVEGAVYHIEDGHIEWMGGHPEQDKLVAEGLAQHAD
jgi:carbonic anhydrase